MVEVLMGDEDVVRLGHGGIGYGLIAQLCHGVDLNFLAAVFDADGGVHKCVDLYGLAALGGETVGLEAVVALLPAGGGQYQ